MSDDERNGGGWGKIVLTVIGCLIVAGVCSFFAFVMSKTACDAKQDSKIEQNTKDITRHEELLKEIREQKPLLERILERLPR